jgi:APA family basic amino acid/polyamine antiporter
VNEASGGLVRTLGTLDAVVIGLAAMVGAGVFTVFGPAARAAGTALLVGLVLAAVIAYCNAVASAQLAMAYPTSGGTYSYGRERLGPWWGFVAGWGFVVGKTASCAAMALTFAEYAVPGPWWARRLAAIASVLVLAAVNYRGVGKTALVTRVLIAAVLAVLGLVVGAVGIAVGTGAVPVDIAVRPLSTGSIYGVLQAAGLLFFAFAGYARVATLGAEVRDPRRTIPRAILIAFTIATSVYLLVGVAALMAAGPERLSSSTAPLVTALSAVEAGALAPTVRVGAALASLGALVTLIAGVGRTALAMASNRDLPVWLAAVHPRYRVPHHAELTVAAVVCAIVLTTDPRGAIGFSSFGVLIYYAIANASALTQPEPDRRWPRTVNGLGVLGCLTLAATLPVGSVVAGLGVFAAGTTGRWWVLRGRSDP